MPDIRAMNALTQGWYSQRESLARLLREAGYDPASLDALPDPGECPCALGRAIRQWQQLNDQLAQAEARTSGWRY